MPASSRSLRPEAPKPKSISYPLLLLDRLRRLRDHRTPNLPLLTDEGGQLLGRGQANVSAEILVALLELRLGQHLAQIVADPARQRGRRPGRRDKRQPAHRL